MVLKRFKRTQTLPISPDRADIPSRFLTRGIKAKAGQKAVLKTESNASVN
jgi:hypothetical protein